jgi:uncharacterized protein
MVDQGSVAVTTDAVLLECGNALARTTMRSTVVGLRDALMANRRLIIPEPEDIEHAGEEYRSGDAGGPGIVDLISFQVMRRLGISEVFTNDRHFKTAGFVTLF